MSSKWTIGYYGLGKAHLRLEKEELPCSGLHLHMEAGRMPVLELTLCPRLMEAELEEAIVRALPSHKHERYEHHGNEVWVDSALKGLHRAYCLCFQCAKFKPNTDENCPIAQSTYENCVEHGLVTPVWECPEFEEA